MDVPEGVQLVGFADDLALLAVGETSDTLEEVVNPTLDAIDGWMGAHGLQLARHKTEAIVLTKKWAYRDPVFVVGSHSSFAKEVAIPGTSSGLTPYIQWTLHYCFGEGVPGSTGYRTAHAQPWRTLTVQESAANVCVTRAYRTVSAEAALFLAGTPPGVFLLWNAKESEVNSTTRTELTQRMRSGEQSVTSCLLLGRTGGVVALEEPGRARFFRTC
ncbi:hypothetical protein QTP88_026810 [Uroleucon formosanum]